MLPYFYCIPLFNHILLQHINKTALIMLMQYLKTGMFAVLLLMFIVTGMHADEKLKSESTGHAIKNGPATPLVTWNGKDLTVSSSEVIDRVVLSGESHEVLDTVAVIALDANCGIVGITVETASGDYDCEIDTDAEDTTPEGDD